MFLHAAIRRLVFSPLWSNVESSAIAGRSASHQQVCLTNSSINLQQTGSTVHLDYRLRQRQMCSLPLYGYIQVSSHHTLMQDVAAAPPTTRGSVITIRVTSAPPRISWLKSSPNLTRSLQCASLCRLRSQAISFSLHN